MRALFYQGFGGCRAIKAGELPAPGVFGKIVVTVA
jgi:hypothetical protein